VKCLQAVSVLSLGQLGPLDTQTYSLVRSGSASRRATRVKGQNEPTILGQSSTQTTRRRRHARTQGGVKDDARGGVAGSSYDYTTIGKYGSGTASGGAYQGARQDRSSLIVQTREGQSITGHTGGETLGVHIKIVDDVRTDGYINEGSVNIDYRHLIKERFLNFFRVKIIF
jgi:hypothetical protein